MPIVSYNRTAPELPPKIIINGFIDEKECKMKGFCPSCQKESELTPIHRVENLSIKGENISVDVKFFVCTECNEEFDDPDPEYDPLALAYQEYRKRKGMVQPQDIRAFREKYEITQRELSELLGFGGATLSRYENGALQDQTHDTILHLVIFSPENLLDMIKNRQDIFGPEKQNALMTQLKDEISRSRVIREISWRPEYRNRNIFNGFREIDIDRLINAVKVFCFQTRVYKTKLNKLLFYADFKHFKQYGTSITGLCYAHLPHGPVPEQYDLLFQRLTEIDPSLTIEEDLELDCSAELFHCSTSPDTNLFILTELEVLFQVRDYFKQYTAKRIRNFSHEEPGYKQTRHLDLISYDFAKNLQI